MAPNSPPIPPPHPFKLADLKVGSMDPRNRVVKDILWSMADFKIFKTVNGISPIFSDDPKIASVQKKNYFAMGDGIAEFNHLIYALRPIWPFRRFVQEDPESDSSRTINHYERELARCIAQALSGQVEEAKAALRRLHERLADRVANRGRITHLVVNLVLVLVAIIGGVLFSAFGKSVLGFNVEEMSVAIMMGSLGALFSTTVTLKSMKVDPTVSLWMHIVYGGQRVLVGAMGALILYFGFRSGIVSGLFQPAQSTLADALVSALSNAKSFDVYWLSFVSILAGFSERLVPNLLTNKAEDAMNAADAEPAAPAPLQPQAGAAPDPSASVDPGVDTAPGSAGTVPAGAGGAAQPAIFDSRRNENGNGHN